MFPASKMASVSVGLLLSCGVSVGAWGAIPSAYSLKAGTVLSTHTEETNACRITTWHMWIRPGETVEGTFSEELTNKTWELSGTYDSHGTFHLNDREAGNPGRTGTVDAQVQSDGSLIMRIANTGDPSPCYNRTVYLPWFRNGNDFDAHFGF